MYIYLNGALQLLGIVWSFASYKTINNNYNESHAWLDAVMFGSERLTMCCIVSCTTGMDSCKHNR